MFPEIKLVSFQGFFFFPVCLGTEPRASHMHSATKLHPGLLYLTSCFPECRLVFKTAECAPSCTHMGTPAHVPGFCPSAQIFVKSRSSLPGHSFPPPLQALTHHLPVKPSFLQRVPPYPSLSHKDSFCATHSEEAVPATPQGVSQRRSEKTEQHYPSPTIHVGKRLQQTSDTMARYRNPHITDQISDITISIPYSLFALLRGTCTHMV